MQYYRLWFTANQIDLSDCDRYWPSIERLVLADNRLKEVLFAASFLY